MKSSIVLGIAGVAGPKGAGFAALLSLATLVNLAIGFAYYVWLLTAYGATLGKMAMGVKVVTPEGGPLSRSAIIVAWPPTNAIRSSLVRPNLYRRMSSGRARRRARATR